MLKLESTVQLVIDFGFHSSSMKDADHDAKWLAFLNEVRQARAHAPNCTAMSAMSKLRSASVIWKHTVGDVVDVHGRERCESV